LKVAIVFIPDLAAVGRVPDYATLGEDRMA